MQCIITRLNAQTLPRFAKIFFFRQRAIFTAFIVGEKKAMNIKYLLWKWDTSSNPAYSATEGKCILSTGASLYSLRMDWLFWSLLGFMNSFLSLMSVATYLNETFEKTAGPRVCFSASDCCCYHWKWTLTGCFKKTRSSNTCNCFVTAPMV